MHRNYIGAVERAERTPSTVQAAKLARVLGTTLSAMLAEVEWGEVKRLQWAVRNRELSLVEVITATRRLSMHLQIQGPHRS